jgi:beta-alanine--pyruvate transaminase
MKLDHYWMPFTDNRRFKAKPRLVASAKDMYYTTAEGRQVLDGLATLWCVNAGHGRPRIVEAIRRQAGELDFASSFGIGHPLPFRLAERIAALAPAGMGHVFFTNSGSEAIDTALKIAVGYHRLRGEGTRTRFIGRERSYHGVNIGGTSIGGVGPNRKAYSGILLPGVDHLRHTHDPKRAFTRGCAQSGAELADELEERIVPLHDASNIAAVIVDPVSASGGVLIPPQGYLQRLREICTRHGILLVFDEVITAWGRLNAPFAAQRFGVEPDLITFAKGITSGAVPLGGVLVKNAVFETFMAAQASGMEFFHGYTYSGHPLACAAGLAALDTYEEEGLFRKSELAQHFEDGIHSLKDRPHVVDCRNLGLIGAVELAPRPGAAGARAYEVFEKCWDKGVFVRPVGEALAFCPPLIAQQKHLDQLFGTVAEVLGTID